MSKGETYYNGNEKEKKKMLILDGKKRWREEEHRADFFQAKCGVFGEIYTYKIIYNF